MRVSPSIVSVGGGIAGLATAWWLGQRGNCQVVLVESEPELGLHSTGRNASILRTAISDGPVRQLATEARRFLCDPPRNFARAPLLEACGLVVVTHATFSSFDPLIGVGGGLSILQGFARLNLSKGLEPDRDLRFDLLFRAPR